MKPFCDELQERLASEGTQAMAHDAVFRDQVQQCEDCRAFALALARVDSGLDQLGPVLAPVQAKTALARFSAKLDHSTITLHSTEDQPGSLAREPVRRGLPMALAASIVLAAIAGLFSGEAYRLEALEDMASSIQSSVAGLGAVEQVASTQYGEPQADQEGLNNRLSRRFNQPGPEKAGAGSSITAATESLAATADRVAAKPASAPVPSTPRQDNDAPSQAIALGFAQAEESLNSNDSVRESEPSRQTESSSRSGSRSRSEASLAPPAPLAKNTSGDTTHGGLSNEAMAAASAGPARLADQRSLPEKISGEMQQEHARLEESAALKADQREASAPPPPIPPAEEADGELRSAGKSRAKKAISSLENNVIPDVGREGALASSDSVSGQRQQWAQSATRKESKQIKAERPILIGEDLNQNPMRATGRMQMKGSDPKVNRPVRVTAVPQSVDRADQSAQSFMLARERTSNLRFQNPIGYWRNTYIPGDPALRLLQAQLQSWDRTAIQRTLPGAMLESGVRRNAQPFDVPTHSALAIYLQADKSAVSGPARLRLQLGLQASRRQGGTRPAMNVAMVIDLRKPADAEAMARVRALIDAMLRGKQAGDRFSLTVAYPGGGLYLAPKHFRHGPLTLTMQMLSGQKPITELKTIGATPMPLPDLHAALAAAADSVRQGNEPEAPLGASMVLLAVAASLSDEQARLQHLVHQMAVDGIVTSVVALGAVALEEIDRLVLYGHGHRRILGRPGDAAAIVDRELHAVSGVVARVVRLNIKLNPKVKLVSVLGSQPLDKLVTERVREAERSVDLKVARSLGITADRGNDEEGIQIVIPSFLAGDHHVVILDVLVPGGGPVAEVTVRYKDLVSRRNGVARTNFTLVSGRNRMGPLELNVVKNQLALHFAEQITLASQDLSQSRYVLARQRLSELRLLLDGMRRSLAGLSSDEDLLRDERLVSEFIALSVNPVARAENIQLANAMRYAALAKLQAKP